MLEIIERIVDENHSHDGSRSCVVLAQRLGVSCASTSPGNEGDGHANISTEILLPACNIATEEGCGGPSDQIPAIEAQVDHVLLIV